MVLVQTTLEGARAEIEKTDAQLGKLETRLNTVLHVGARYTAFIRGMGFDENADVAMRKMQEVMTMMIQLTTTAYALNAALAGTPFGWFLFALSAIGLFSTAQDFAMDGW